LAAALGGASGLAAVWGLGGISNTTVVWDSGGASGRTAALGLASGLAAVRDLGGGWDLAAVRGFDPCVLAGGRSCVRRPCCFCEEGRDGSGGPSLWFRRFLRRRSWVSSRSIRCVSVQRVSSLFGFFRVSFMESSFFILEEKW